MKVFLVRELSYGHDETPAVVGVYATQKLADRAVLVNARWTYNGLPESIVQEWEVRDHLCSEGCLCEYPE